MKLQISTAMVAVVISAISLTLSLLTYYRNSQSVQLKLQQTGSMRVVAGQSMIIWDQLEKVINAQATRLDVDPYLYTSLKQNCLRLEESLDRAVGLGLYADLVGDRPDALQMHTAFRQSLAWVHTIDPDDSMPEDWTSLHLVMGMIRLLDQTKSYEADLLPDTYWDEISIPQNMQDLAWSYLREDFAYE